MTSRDTSQMELGGGAGGGVMSKGIMGFVIYFLMGQQQQTPDADRYGRCLKNASHISDHMLE